MLIIILGLLKSKPSLDGSGSQQESRGISSRPSKVSSDSFFLDRSCLLLLPTPVHVRLTQGLASKAL